MSRLLTVREAARELAIGRSTLYELLGKGQIAAVKVSDRAVRIPAAELDRFVAELPRSGQPPKAA